MNIVENKLKTLRELYDVDREAFDVKRLIKDALDNKKENYIIVNSYDVVNEAIFMRFTKDNFELPFNEILLYKITYPEMVDQLGRLNQSMLRLNIVDCYFQCEILYEDLIEKKVKALKLQ